jgi:uncharacterized membrane protein
MNWALVVLLTVVAFLIRCYNLSIDPVWIDEAATLQIASLSVGDLLGEMARIESSPSGFYLLAKGWIGLFGTEIGNVRLLPAIAGALAVVPIWIFARNAFNERTAWLSASLLALAASHVRLSQDARTYTVLFLVFCFAMVVALRLIRIPSVDRHSISLIIALGVLQGILGWLHATSVVLIFALGVFVVAGTAVGPMGFRRGVAVVVACGLVTLLVAALPFASALRHLVQPEFADRWIARPSVLETLAVYGRTLVAPFLYWLSPVAGVIAAALLLLAVIVGLLHRSAPTIALAAMLIAAGIAMPLLSNVAPVLLDRTILFLWAPVYLLISAGAAAIPGRAFHLAGISLLLLQGVGLVNYYRLEIRKEQWPAAAALVAVQAGQLQPIVVTEGAFAALALSIPLKALGEASPRIIVVPPTSELERFVAKHSMYEVVTRPSDLCPVIAGASAVWVVSRALPASVKGDEGFTSRAGVVGALRAASSTLVSHESVAGVDVERWTPPRCL